MKSGYIYILSNPSFKDNLLKIGHTTRDVPTRAKKLRTTGVPEPFTIVYAEDVDNPETIEKIIHENLANFRLSKQREFFEISIEKAISKVQEVTQRLVYEKNTYILDKNIVFRWLCQTEDLVFLVRNPDTFSDELKIDPIVDFWYCKTGDQILITNIPGKDKIYLGEDKYITLPLKKSSNNHDINPINGIIHEFYDINPGDRIVWLAKSKENININQEYHLHSILTCRTAAKLSGFSDPKQIASSNGFPLFGCDLSLTEIPENSIKVLRECLIKIKSEWKNDIFIPPTDEVEKLLNELLKMSEICPQNIYSSNRKVYLGKNKKRVREIGERLNEIGRLHLMILVARQIPNHDRRQLEFAWSGIGEWMS
jgi:hypothetical protein